MEKMGKIARVHKALRIELDARPGAELVVGAGDVKRLINDGATVRVYQVTRSADVDIIEDVGAAYPTRSGRGIAVNITAGAPLLPVIYASKAQVEAVHAGLRSAAVVSGPEDLRVPHREERRSIDRGLKRGFGDAGNPPVRKRDHTSFRVIA
ncbi:MAG: hypothetical protein PHQ81_06800 [Methanofollis sp.]|nr:hypothetical protein [Methanofollis sp.]